MVIKEALLAAHSKSQTIRIVNYIGDDNIRLAELMQCFFCDEVKVSQRAAWCVSCIGIKFQKNIAPYLTRMIDLLDKDVHGAIKRNILRMLEFIEIPKKHKGKLINNCFEILISAKEPIAVKVFAMSVLAHISEEAPDIKNELRLILEDQIPFSRPGFISRAKKVLKEIR